MLDLVFLLLALRALVGSLRHRFFGGAIAAAFSIAVFAVAAASGWYARRFDELAMSGMGLLTIFGPSSLPQSSDAVPLSALVSAHPVVTKAVSAIALLAAYAALSRRAKAAPLDPRTADDDRLSLRFVAAAMLALATPVVLALGEMIAPSP